MSNNLRLKSALLLVVLVVSAAVGVYPLLAPRFDRMLASDPGSSPVPHATPQQPTGIPTADAPHADGSPRQPPISRG